MNDYPPGLYFHMKVKTHPKSSGLVRMPYDVFSTNCVSVLLSEKRAKFDFGIIYVGDVAECRGSKPNYPFNM